MNRPIDTSNKILAFSLSQNFFYYKERSCLTKKNVALLGPDNFFLTTWKPDNLFFNK